MEIEIERHKMAFVRERIREPEAFETAAAVFDRSVAMIQALNNRIT